MVIQRLRIIQLEKLYSEGSQWKKVKNLQVI